MIDAQGANRVNELIGRLLDRGYAQATAATLRAIAASTSTGLIAQRLNELDSEVARLAADGQRLTADNPVLRALLADLDVTLRRDATRIDVASEDVQSNGAQVGSTTARQLALPGLNDAALAQIGIRWNVVNPEAINAAVGYTTSAAWQNELSRYADVIAETVRNQAIRGLVEGWGPLRTARAIRQITEGLPASYANTMMRTLQLQSYRDASAISQQANASIISHQIRIGTLDGRICMACLALHGTRLEVGERVQDHHNGRCIGVPIVRGVERQVMTGEAYWAALPDENQRALAGDAAYELIRSGRAELRDFVQRYDDPVYNEMIREASVKHVLAQRGQ